MNNDNWIEFPKTTSMRDTKYPPGRYLCWRTDWNTQATLDFDGGWFDDYGKPVDCVIAFQPLPSCPSFLLQRRELFVSSCKSLFSKLEASGFKIVYIHDRQAAVEKEMGPYERFLVNFEESENRMTYSIISISNPKCIVTRKINVRKEDHDKIVSLILKDYDEYFRL